MKLKTSFFNPTVLKKDLTRFSPVWGLYTIFQLLFLLLLWGDESTPARFAVNVADVMMGMGIVNLLYAALCAFLLFGDLFKSRMCNMLHALPMRREGWFLTHLTAGFLFCLLPCLAGALLATLLLQQYAYGAFLWLAVTLLQYLFFFGVAVFAVMCAGNALGALAIYGLFNFLAFLMAWLSLTFYEPVLYGVKLNLETIAKGSPIMSFSLSQFFDFRYDNMTEIASFIFYPEDWEYLWVAAAVGVALLGLSLVCYRRRDLETAADLISWKPMAPIFLVIYTLCAGAVLYFVAETFSNGLQYVFLLIGFAIGFFTGKMLLEKRVNVFRLKNAAQFGILVAAFVLSIVVAILDPFGLTRYVPKPEQVTSMRISPYTSAYYVNNESCVLTDQADIARITELHQELVNTRPQHGDTQVVMQYQTAAGTTVERHYPISTNSEQWQLLQGYYSSMLCIFGTEDIPDLLRRTTEINIYPHEGQKYQINILSRGAAGTTIRVEGADLNTTQAVIETIDSATFVRELFDALTADCKAGRLTQYHDYRNGPDADSIYSLTITYLDGQNKYGYKDIIIYADCTNTIAYLDHYAASLEK